MKSGGHVTLVEIMLLNTSAKDRLEKPTLRETLAKAKMSSIQIGPDHAVWSGVRRLFPEIYDGLLRAELEDLGELPVWAT
jgi:hypothetical protein